MENKTTFMNLKTDFAFKRLFGTRENTHILRQFLNVVLPDEMNVTEIEFRCQEMLPAQSDGKKIIYDVYCTTSDGRHFILEMQNLYTPMFENRVMYYACKPIVMQGMKGWNYSLNPVVVILVTKFNFPHLPVVPKHEICMYDKTTSTDFSDRLKIINISLEECKKNWDDCDNEFEEMTYLIKNMDKLDKEGKEYQSGRYTDWFDASEVDSLCEEDCVRYGESLQAYQDTQEGIRYAAEKAAEQVAEKRYKEGREEGFLSAVTAFVRTLRDKGLSVSEITSLTNLPVAQIEGILGGC